MAKKKRVKKAGPGKKTCPSCKAVVGARTQNCDCGHAFVRRSQSGKLPQSLLRCSLTELEALVEAKRQLAEPLMKLIDKHGAQAVLTEVRRLAKA